MFLVDTNAFLEILQTNYRNHGLTFQKGGGWRILRNYFYDRRSHARSGLYGRDIDPIQRK